MSAPQTWHWQFWGCLMQGTDGRDRPDVDIWKLVDYDPICTNWTLMRNQIADAIINTPNAGKVGDNLMLLGRQLRECIYDRIAKGCK